MTMPWEDYQSNASTGPWLDYQPKTYTQNVGQDWSNAENKIGQLWANQQTGEGQQINPASTGLQMLGTAAGAVYAPAGEAAKSAYNSLPDAITQPINNAASSAMQTGQQAYATGVDKLANTRPGNEIGDYLMNSPHIQNGMQEVSDDAKALANLLTLSKAKEVSGDTSMAIGDKLVDSGEAAQDAAKQSYMQDLVRPKEIPTVQADNALRTIQVNGKNIYQPSAQEQQMAKNVSNIPGVSKSNSVQGNLSAIVSANKDEAAALQSRLQKNPVSVDLGDVQNGINKIIPDLKNHPYITGDGESAALKVVNMMNESVLKNAGQNGTITTANLLQARKDFDNGLPERIFTSPTDTATTVAAKSLRSMLNNIIATADPSADVLASLKKQSTLYDAADNIAPKAAGEAPTKLGRAMQSLSPSSMKGAISNAGLGAALLAGSHYISVPPAAVAGAAGVYGVSKAAMSPTTRVLLGKALGGGQ